MRTISYTATNRPELFRRALRSLCANDLAGWEVRIAIEPTEAARNIVEIASTELPAAAITVNERRLGITDNPFQLLETTFASGSEVNIYLEDDLVVSPDMTQLAQWYFENHQPHWLCLNLMAGVCGSAGMLSMPDTPDMLFETTGFNSLGFVARRAEWEKYIRQVWPATGHPTPLAPVGWRFPPGWDWSVYALLAESETLRCLQPVAARANNLPSANGTYGSLNWNEMAFDHLKIADARDVQFVVRQTGDLPSTAQTFVRLQDELIKARVRIARYEAGHDNRLHSVTNSRSWRFTAPLRFLWDTLRRR